jgi:hypothetical protein
MKAYTVKKTIVVHDSTPHPVIFAICILLKLIVEGAN